MRKTRRSQNPETNCFQNFACIKKKFASLLPIRPISHSCMQNRNVNYGNFLSWTASSNLLPFQCTLRRCNITDHYKPASWKITIHHFNPYLLKPARRVIHQSTAVNASVTSDFTPSPPVTSRFHAAVVAVIASLLSSGDSEAAQSKSDRAAVSVMRANNQSSGVVRPPLRGDD